MKNFKKYSSLLIFIMMLSIISAALVAGTGNTNQNQIVYPSDGSTNPIQSAIDNAAPGSTIMVTPGTYCGPIHISKSITLKAYDPNSHPIIDAQLRGVAITINNGCNVEIDGFTIKNGGEISDYGGGTHNEGTLTLKNSELNNNIAGGIGGGIYNIGTLNTYNVQITQNTAKGIVGHATGGAGIYNNGIMNLFDTVISNNRCGHGAGIYNDINGQAVVHRVSISDNSFGLYSTGAGIHNNGNFRMIDSSVKHNSAVSGAGIYNTGTFSISSSNIQDNGAGIGFGGGIYNNNSLYIENSAIQNNVAGYGGGISNSGILNICHSAIQYNTAAHNGGGLYNQGTYHLDRETSIINNNPDNIYS